MHSLGLSLLRFRFYVDRTKREGKKIILHIVPGYDYTVAAIKKIHNIDKLNIVF